MIGVDSINKHSIDPVGTMLRRILDRLAAQSVPLTTHYYAAEAARRRPLNCAFVFELDGAPPLSLVQRRVQRVENQWRDVVCAEPTASGIQALPNVSIPVGSVQVDSESDIDEAVTRCVNRTFEPSTPNCFVTLIRGPDPTKSVLVTGVNHSLCDGQLGAAVYGTMFDDSDEWLSILKATHSRPPSTWVQRCAATAALVPQLASILAHRPLTNYPTTFRPSIRWHRMPAADLARWRVGGSVNATFVTKVKNCIAEYSEGTTAVTIGMAVDNGKPLDRNARNSHTYTLCSIRADDDVASVNKKVRASLGAWDLGAAMQSGAHSAGRLVEFMRALYRLTDVGVSTVPMPTSAATTLGSHPVRRIWSVTNLPAPTFHLTIHNGSANVSLTADAETVDWERLRAAAERHLG